MQRFTAPYPILIDTFGAVLDGGKVYIGVAGQDPALDPINLFTDKDLTQAIVQPLGVLGGMIRDGANPTFIYMAEADYSVRVVDQNDVEVFYCDTIEPLATVSYQPLDADLTSIAALATTSYGRNLLTLSNQAALQSAVGISAGLATTGGTITGNIVRSGAGAHIYHASATNTGGSLTVSAASGGNTSPVTPGSIWFGT